MCYGIWQALVAPPATQIGKAAAVIPVFSKRGACGGPWRCSWLLDKELKAWRLPCGFRQSPGKPTASISEALHPADLGVLPPTQGRPAVLGAGLRPRWWEAARGLPAHRAARRCILLVLLWYYSPNHFQTPKYVKQDDVKTVRLL